MAVCEVCGDDEGRSICSVCLEPLLDDSAVARIIADCLGGAEQDYYWISERIKFELT